jgi:hypothetical protein
MVNSYAWICCTWSLVQVCTQGWSRERESEWEERERCPEGATAPGFPSYRLIRGIPRYHKALSIPEGCLRWWGLLEFMLSH